MFRHADGEKKPRKRSKRERERESTQEPVAILKHRKVQGCVSKNSDPKKSILRKAGQVRLNASAAHTMKFSGRTPGTKCEFGREKKAISRPYPKRRTS